MNKNSNMKGLYSEKDKKKYLFITIYSVTIVTALMYAVFYGMNIYGKDFKIEYFHILEYMMLASYCFVVLKSIFNFSAKDAHKKFIRNIELMIILLVMITIIITILNMTI